MKRGSISLVPTSLIPFYCHIMWIEVAWNQKPYFTCLAFQSCSYSIFVYWCDMWVEELQSHTPVLLCCFLVPPLLVCIDCRDVWIERPWNTLPHCHLAALLVPINSHDVWIERPRTTVFVLVRIQPSPSILESYMSTRLARELLAIPRLWPELVLSRQSLPYLSIPRIGHT